MADSIADATRKWLEKENSQYETVHTYGAITAPAAAATLANIAAGSLPAGYYRIEADASIDAGAPAAAERDNMEVREGSTAIKRLIINPITSPTPARTVLYRFLDGSTALSVNVIGAATASVVYRASITATRLS